MAVSETACFGGLFPRAPADVHLEMRSIQSDNLVTNASSLFREFGGSMMQEFEMTKPFELGKLKTIWGMKLEFALRTALAALLAAVYAVHPEVQRGEWENATVFAPVLAIACVSGPSLGATLHHAWEMWQATVIGCLSSMIMNEALRPVRPFALREALMLGAFLATVFFLCSRPWALVQKRVSVGVMLCGTINMSVTHHAKPWWFPWTIGVPCTVGVVAAVIAMCLPRPWLACRELRTRLAFQAWSERHVLIEQYHAFAGADSMHHAAAAHLISAFRDNQAKMKALLTPASWELFFYPETTERLGAAVKFFESQLSALRMLQSTTAPMTKNTASVTHVKFQCITDRSWHSTLKAVAACVDDVVAAELEERGVQEDKLLRLEKSWSQLEEDTLKARSRIMYQGGAQYDESEHRTEHHFEHVNRMTCYFALHEILSVTSACAKFGLKTPKRRSFNLGRCVLHWFSPPSTMVAQDAFKKVLSLGVLCILAWIPELREQRPEFIWGFIAASFIFSDYEGSSISTGLGRVIGTLFGGMVGFLALFLLELIEWGELEVLELAAYVVVCVTWTFLCSLSRSSPRHGYTATVAGFSIYIMVVGRLESFGAKASKDVVFQRTQEQFLGAAIYMVVEMSLWRKSARAQVDDQQVRILQAIKESLSDAAHPHVMTAGQESSSSSALSSDESSTPKMELEAKQVAQAAIAGNAALDAAKQGMVAANYEPSLWHKPFPLADYSRLLHTEEKALRLTHVLHAASRAAATDTLDADVPGLVATYTARAISSLQSAIEQLEDPADQTDPFTTWSVDLGSYLTAHRSDKRALEGNIVHCIEASLKLMDLQKADASMRRAAERHFQRFKTHQPNSNGSAYCVNATVFCLLNFTSLMTELADRLRVVQAAEQAVVYV
ncbi:unnamed protein product [Effrenium voratum]|uniref:Integral membrane bound transporter domain-containing protein n=1 Tax=Effrenium voratum TaxID=2562239 RepID=A0AA36HJJ2_9DINO|nr:unnamed protein product [Effrenium voratum]CAJ1443118.1 unnamed protein product [Effrenium voratum]